MNPNNEIPPGCAPFDLEKALAGAKVRTKCGKHIEQIHHFKIQNPFSVYGIFNDQIFSWRIDGSYREGTNSDFDLFMVREKRVLWVASSKDGSDLQCVISPGQIDNYRSAGQDVAKFEEVL